MLERARSLIDARRTQEYAPDANLPVYLFTRQKQSKWVLPRLQFADVEENETSQKRSRRDSQGDEVTATLHHVLEELDPNLFIELLRAWAHPTH